MFRVLSEHRVEIPLADDLLAARLASVPPLSESVDEHLTARKRPSEEPSNGPKLRVHESEVRPERAPPRLVRRLNCPKLTMHLSTPAIQAKDTGSDNLGPSGAPI